MKTRLQQLIEATGFDTFEQAMAFIREQRELCNWAEKPTPKMTKEESLDRMMRDYLSRQIEKQEAEE